MQRTFVCSGCRDPKPHRDFHENTHGKGVTSRCRSCRREDYYRKRYPDTVCGQCRRHRPLDKNLVCRACNHEGGLKQCRGPCGELLAEGLEFYEERAICKQCIKSKRFFVDNKTDGDSVDTCSPTPTS